MSTDIKLSKTQMSKMIQSGGSFSSWLANFGKKTLTNIVISLARDNLPGLVSNLTSNKINEFERKISGKGAFRAEKGFTLFISNEDMNDITKIIKPLEDLGVLIDGVTETVKDEIEKREGGFLGALLAPSAASLVQPVISSVVKRISRRGVRRTGREYIKFFRSAPSFKDYFNDQPRFNGVFSRNKLPRKKDGAYIINLDHENSKGTNWVSLFVNKNAAVYFDSLKLNIFLKKY